MKDARRALLCALCVVLCACGEGPPGAHGTPGPPDAGTELVDLGDDPLRACMMQTLPRLTVVGAQLVIRCGDRMLPTRLKGINRSGLQHKNGLLAAGLGFALGAPFAPRMAAPSAETLIGSPTIAANPWHMLVAAALVLPVLVAGALASTQRSTRLTVVEAIRAGNVSPPDSRLARAVARRRLPLTIGLGLKDFLARGRRAFLLTSGIVVTGVVVVSALSLDATLAAQPAGVASDFPDELLILIYALDAVLLLITATTLVAVALLAVRERVRDIGVHKAIGLTPRQIVSTVIGGQATLALLASLVAVPLGVAVYFALVKLASGTTDEAVVAAWWTLALVPVATAVVVVAATSLPAWVASRIRAADALRYE